jgi:transportin-1
VLALGSLAEGCDTAMRPYLAATVEYLFQISSDPQPFLRSISCWALSRYSGSFVELDPSGELGLLRQYLQHLMARVCDGDSLVQEAACVSAAGLMESMPKKLAPYADDVLQVLVSVIEAYKGPVLAYLYDAIGKLLEEVYSDKLASNPRALNLILPPLFKQWETLKDTDRLLCPLLECYQSLIAAMGVTFEQYAKPVLERCLRLLGSLLPLIEEDAKNANSASRVDIEFLVRAIDVIGALCNALNERMDTLLAQFGPAPGNIFLAGCQVSN